MSNYQTYDLYRANDNHWIPRSIPVFMVVVWVFYILLSPIYFYDSGLPKPADFILTVGLFPAFIIALMSRDRHLDGVFLTGMSFAVLTMVVNIIHYYFTPERTFLMASLFYIYNFMVFSFVVFLFKRAPLMMNQITYFCLAVTIIGEFLYVLLLDDSGPRHIGSFNNPNQLAYWSLLSASMLVVLKRSQSFNIFDLLLFAICAFIQTEALSKAGLVTFGLMTVSMAFSPVTNRKLKAVFMLGIATLIILKLTAPHEAGALLSSADNIDAAVTRLEKIGEDNDDSIEGRGYYRIIENPLYILAGAGEGAHWRFGYVHELHSGIATILFSYGILGFTLFCAFLVLVYRRLPLYYGLLLIAILLYGLTHQNFRTTSFWVFLGVSYAYIYFKPEKERRDTEREHRLDYFIKQK